MHDKSIVVWHDYAWQPGNIRYETMAAILDAVPDHARKKIYGVRNTLCAMYYPGEIDSGPASSVAEIDEIFEVTIRQG